MKRVILIIFIAIITLSACSQVEEPEVIIEDEELLPREEVLLKFLAKMYSISDSNEYEIYIENFEEYLLEENFSKLYFGYDEMCTEDGLNSVISNRLHSYYREAALAGDFTMLLNKTDYTQAFDEKADGTILREYRTVGYEFSVELKIEYSDGEIEYIVEEGFVNLKNMDGEWKVDLFQLKEFKEFWINFTMPD